MKTITTAKKTASNVKSIAGAAKPTAPVHVVSNKDKPTYKVKRFGKLQFISAADACRLIGISENTFSMWKARGMYIDNMTVHQFGSRQYYNISSVRKLAKRYVKYSRSGRITPDTAGEKMPVKAEKATKVKKVQRALKKSVDTNAALLEMIQKLNEKLDLLTAK